MMKVNKTFSGNIQCYDEQMLSYSINYTCVVERSIFSCNMKTKAANFNSVIEGTIREIVAENKMKYFIKEVDNQFNKERNAWIDLPKTEKAEKEIRDNIIRVLTDRAKEFDFNLITFKWMPTQSCHTLAAALS